MQIWCQNLNVSQSYSKKSEKIPLNRAHVQAHAIMASGFQEIPIFRTTKMAITSLIIKIFLKFKNWHNQDGDSHLFHSYSEVLSHTENPGWHSYYYHIKAHFPRLSPVRAWSQHFASFSCFMHSAGNWNRDSELNLGQVTLLKFKVSPVQVTLLKFTVSLSQVMKLNPAAKSLGQ